MIYLYDGWQCVEERELDGGTWVMRRQYVYGGQYIDEPVLFDNDTDGDEDIDVSYWYLHDTNYNVVALADNAGSTVERCWYEPYGPTTFTNASGTANTPATESDYANTLAFQGQRLDDESGLYYFRNRHYSPVLGRFVQRDPVGYLDGMNLYTFLRSQPIIGGDPMGWKCNAKKRNVEVITVSLGPAESGGYSIQNPLAWLEEHFKNDSFLFALFSLDPAKAGAEEVAKAVAEIAGLDQETQLLLMLVMKGRGIKKEGLKTTDALGIAADILSLPTNVRDLYVKAYRESYAKAAELLQQIQKEIMQKSGAAIFVKARGECCEDGEWVQHSGWYRCSQYGKGRMPLRTAVGVKGVEQGPRAFREAPPEFGHGSEWGGFDWEPKTGGDVEGICGAVGECLLEARECFCCWGQMGKCGYFAPGR